MVLKTAADELQIYYRESSEALRTSKFCLKPVQIVQARQERRAEAVNVHVARGKTTTFVQLDEDEAAKVGQHGEAVLRRLHRVHKSVVWSCLIGRSFVDRIQRVGGKQAGCEEVSLEWCDESGDFSTANPRTWSEDGLDFIKSMLKAAEFRYDGFVVLFCVENDQKDASVDYDEIAWELEKSLVYHLMATRGQIVMNDEASMARRGAEPLSRKTKTPGRKKSGYCVYIAYQLADSVTHDQAVGEAVNKAVDLSQKKRQLMASLTEAKLPPQVDERLRKQIKETKEFMSRDQLAMVARLKEVRDEESLVSVMLMSL